MTLKNVNYNLVLLKNIIRLYQVNINNKGVDSSISGQELVALHPGQQLQEPADGLLHGVPSVNSE